MTPQPQLKTIYEMRKGGVTLKRMQGHLAILRHDIETRGGTRFEKGETVYFHGGPGQLGLCIRSLDKLPNGCPRVCSRVGSGELYYAPNQKPPDVVKPKRTGRPETFPCDNSARCTNICHRLTDFRGCCSVSCWAVFHASQAEKIIRAHFKRSES